MGKSTDIRQQEIIEATMDLAAEQGIKKLTTQAIADRVGIAQPTIFRHFKTRDAIFAAAVGWIAENMFYLLDQLEGTQAPADERLHWLLKRQMAFVDKRRGIPRLMFSDRLHVESPQLKAAVREIYQRILKRIARLLVEGQEAGRFRADLDAEETARFIGALMQGTVMRWSLLDFSFSLEEEAEAMWRLVWSALAPR